jgi:CelD/BcsL family acetyltransferase involved in cellulose biosynthesis
MRIHSQAERSVRVLRSADEFRHVASDWKQLFLRCPDATPFQHPAWLLCWIDAFAPRDLVGIEVRECGRLVGFAPLLIYPRDEQRILAFAGGGVSDYLGLLAEPGRESQVIDDVLCAVDNVSRWDVLDLTDISGRSAIPRHEALMQHSQQHDVCFVLSLPETHDELMHTFSKRQRANLRNARSRTVSEGGAKVERAQADTLQEFLDDLFRLHARRWNEAGETGVLSDERVQEFHRAVAPALLPAGILRLCRMRVNDRSIAAIYALFHRDTVFCYLQGYDPEFAHLSPGNQLMFAVIEDAVRLGMRRFDFLRGAEAYKLHWRPQGEPTHRIQVPRPSLSQLVRYAA